MNPGDLYHQHGVREYVCTRAEYGSKTVVLHIKTKKVAFYCPLCKSTEAVRPGVVTRKFHTVPQGILLEPHCEGLPCVVAAATPRTVATTSGSASSLSPKFAIPVG